MGKRPILSVYNLLLGSTQMWSYLNLTAGIWLVMSRRELRDIG